MAPIPCGLRFLAREGVLTAVLASGGRSGVVRCKRVRWRFVDCGCCGVEEKGAPCPMGIATAGKGVLPAVFASGFRSGVVRGGRSRWRIEVGGCCGIKGGGSASPERLCYS